jgi:hypothetical protein
LRSAVDLARTVASANITISEMADRPASPPMAATFVAFIIAAGQARRDHLPLSIGILVGLAFPLSAAPRCCRSSDGFAVRRAQGRHQRSVLQRLPK